MLLRFLAHILILNLSFERSLLLRRPVKPTVSPRGLTTGSIKTIKNTNILVFLTGSRGQATG
ncbi:hypothetical protein, partial [Rickettsia sp.]|uniref:hypothetical protein n=1 Tax=Rickettsia sp. TaxID=789 RepID=UPI00397C9561